MSTRRGTAVLLEEILDEAKQRAIDGMKATASEYVVRDRYHVVFRAENDARDGELKRKRLRRVCAAFVPRLYRVCAAAKALRMCSEHTKAHRRHTESASLDVCSGPSKLRARNLLCVFAALFAQCRITV